MLTFQSFSAAQVLFATLLCEINLLLAVAEPLTVIVRPVIITTRAGYTFLEQW